MCGLASLKGPLSWDGSRGFWKGLWLPCERPGVLWVAGQCPWSLAGLQPLPHIPVPPPCCRPRGVKAACCPSLGLPSPPMVLGGVTLWDCSCRWGRLSVTGVCACACAGPCGWAWARAPHV